MIVVASGQISKAEVTYPGKERYTMSSAISL
jgi:hypothetical protein